jgi:hypothetical protein
MAKTHVSVNLAPPMFLLFLVFLVLKLTGHIDWSWFYVTMPLWGGIALFLVVMFFILLLALIASILS